MEKESRRKMTLGDLSRIWTRRNCVTKVFLDGESQALGYAECEKCMSREVLDIDTEGAGDNVELFIKIGKVDVEPKGFVTVGDLLGFKFFAERRSWSWGDRVWLSDAEDMKRLVGYVCFSGDYGAKLEYQEQSANSYDSSRPRLLAEDVFERLGLDPEQAEYDEDAGKKVVEAIRDCRVFNLSFDAHLRHCERYEGDYEGYDMCLRLVEAIAYVPALAKEPAESGLSITVNMRKPFVLEPSEFEGVAAKHLSLLKPYERKRLLKALIAKYGSEIDYDEILRFLRQDFGKACEMIGRRLRTYSDGFEFVDKPPCQ